MDGLAFILIAVGIYMIRQAFIGRGPDIGKDSLDILSALSSGEYGTASEVFARKGEVDMFGSTSDADPAETATSGNIGGMQGGANGLLLLKKMRELGDGKPYVWGSTGPSSFDCSGLVWRAMKELKIYTGPRFTTATFGAVAPKFATKISGQEPGAVCVWPGVHMGVCSSTDRYYSALNRKLGIIESGLTGEIERHGTPVYWRVK